MELTIGVLKPKTAKRVIRHIQDSQDIADICSKWTLYLQQPQRAGNINQTGDIIQTGDTKYDNEASQMLNLIKTMADSDIFTVPPNSKKETIRGDFKKDNAELVGTSHGCPSILSFLRSKQSKSRQDKEFQEVGSDSVNFILLGHSNDVKVKVEILKGQPHFEITNSPISISKEGVRKRYHGLYRWPRPNDQGQRNADLFLGEFSDGNNMQLNSLVSIKLILKFYQEDLTDMARFFMLMGAFSSKSLYEVDLLIS